MKMRNKTVKRVLSAVLTLALCTAVLPPAEVYADPELKKPEFDSLGHEMHEASVAFAGNFCPKGGGARFIYYDEGIKYEGTNKLSIYEGARAEFIVNQVPGYKVTVSVTDATFYDQNDQASEAGRFKYFFDSINTYGYPYTDFQMPAQDFTVILNYQEIADLGTVTFTDCDYEEQNLPVNTTFTLPAAPVKEGKVFWAWRVRGSYMQPGETFDVDKYGVTITPVWKPEIDMPDYINDDLAITWQTGVPAIRFTFNTDKMNGKRVKSLHMIAYGDELPEGGEDCDSMQEYGIDFIDYKLSTMPLEIIKKLVVTAETVDDPKKSTVIDLRSGSADLISLAGSEANADAFCTSFFGAYHYDTTRIYMNRLGITTATLYADGMDLNKDGHVDLRKSDVQKDLYYSKYYSFENKLLRTKGADLCEKGTYSFDSGLSDVGSIVIKLFDTCKILFMDGNQLLSEEEVRVGKSCAKPADPEKAGYTFKGWTLDTGSVSDQSKIFDFSEKITKDIKLQAVWAKAESIPVDPKDPNAPKDPEKKDVEKTVIGEAVGTALSDGKTKIVYTVTKQGDGTNPPEVSYSLPKKYQGKKKTVKIPDTITVGGVTYSVTTFDKNALSSEKKATSIVLGSNITSVSSKALKNCKKLKKIKIKNKKEVIRLTKKSFQGIKGKITLLVPGKFVKDYKALIKKLKLTKKVKVKKY
ncbi:MAG: InlB B-repeat-containing protein [Lachnospiraceae bacterium]|nr:InlB B-repeat-containing protein [Lachnospiraceae bacterium]